LIKIDNKLSKKWNKSNKIEVLIKKFKIIVLNQIKIKEIKVLINLNKPQIKVIKNQID
jgi:hypothetical protein